MQRVLLIFTKRGVCDREGCTTVSEHRVPRIVTHMNKEMREEKPVYVTKTANATEDMSFECLCCSTLDNRVRWNPRVSYASTVAIYIRSKTTYKCIQRGNGYKVVRAAPYRRGHNARVHADLNTSYWRHILLKITLFHVLT